MGITTTINPNNINNPTKEILANQTGKPYAPDNPEGLNPNTPTITTSSTTPSYPTLDPNSHSIIPASGFYGDIWPQRFVIPQGLSSAGWTNEAKGFPQQTFLGASIRSFNMNGGFGDNSSSLTVDLVVDEYNVSDGTNFGEGDDVYWSGVNTVNGRKIGDKFVPPIPGSPVFFKFGENFATVEEAYLKTFDDLYYYNTVQPNVVSSAGSINIEEFVKPGNTYTLSANQYVALEDGDPPDGEPDFSVSNSTRKEYPIKDYTSLRSGKYRGVDHIVFGGILQTFTQSRSTNGNPLYTVQVLDPREILSNVTLILNDYGGPTFEQKNILNLYGFLEYNPTEQTENALKGMMPFENKIDKQTVMSGPNVGFFNIVGDDKRYKTKPSNIEDIKNSIKLLQINIASEKRKVSDYRMSGDFVGASASLKAIVDLSNEIRNKKIELVNRINESKPFFPMTGTGFARRGPQGIPYYRVKDAIEALMEFHVDLPQEYKDQGYGGKINFRGYNYVVDFGGLPELPEFYYIDFDQINLLELALEICDITNRDLFVSLLPVINHPACANLYNFNQSASDVDMIAGIIRLDTVDRSEQPFYGAVKTYIDRLKSQNIYVESQDVGYELSNVVTDKFVVGAQEVGSYFFSANNDRDSLAFRKTGQNGVFPNKPPGYQWTLECSLNQQILPFYGKLGNGVTIPKGFGAYQQILLDSSHLNAAGVGSYYVATEMELRCAMISFDRWKEFLKMYNDTYMDSIEVDDTFQKAVTGLTPAPVGPNPPPPVDISDTYVVSVPRSVFDTYILPVNGSVYGEDGLPLSPCNPPYGYPLYYKRMTKIGIPEAGLTDLYTRWTSLLTNFAELQGSNKEEVKGVLNSQYTRLKQLSESQGLTQFEQEYLDEIEKVIKDPTPKKIQETVALLEKSLKRGNKRAFPLMGSMAKKNTQNALKVYNFVRGVAEECLGKKFLVRIPNKVNLFFENNLSTTGNPEFGQYGAGPFGFPPRSPRNIPGYEYSNEFKDQVRQARGQTDASNHVFDTFLNSGVDVAQNKFIGGLAINYNPILEKYESNYVPTNIGGYFSYDLYKNTLGASDLKDIGNKNWSELPPGIKQLLIPQDPTNFIGEDGRIAPYARFDHSEYLSLEGFSTADYSQQLIVGDAIISDLSELLDNTGKDEFHSFPSDPTSNQNNQGDKEGPPKAKPLPQVLFVKCSVDENLYMPPKIIKRKVAVHGQQVKDIGTKSLPAKIFVPCSGIENNSLVEGTGVYIDSFSYYKAHFVPLPQPGSEVEILDFARYNPADLYQIPGGATLNNSTFVVNELDRLDTNFAYALITLPNRVVPTKDARLRDGPYQMVAAERFKHLMTMDVVRDLPGFDLPTNPPESAPTSPFKNVLMKTPPDTKIHAWLAMKKAQSAFSFGFPYQINITFPSPVYPDLVSVPLLSKDRCYGPWVSSQLDGQAYLLKNIGGRVEFIKDENLSPWNYGGYQLLNEAGRLQAEFSNSLLLFSERGSFTVASIPSGNSLCKELINGGPLVTSISVDVGEGGCRTTYQMDLYTSSFGKLQKQKQDLISKISRDRKRLISERNALIRKGLGKNQNRRNFGAEYSTMSAGGMPTLSDMGMGMANAYTKIAVSINSEETNNWSSITGGSINQLNNQIDGSIQQDSDAAKAAQLMNDQFDVADKYQRAASADVADIWVPASYGYHPDMSYKPFTHENARNDLYINREST